MTIPVWVLLGFAAWTLVTLLTSVGVYRWSLILTHKAEIKDFSPDQPQGSPWYRRAMRAHMNCVENLPVYGAIVVAIVAANLQHPLLDILAMTLLVARFCQTVTHLVFEPTNLAVACRFAFFFIQIICMFGMGIFVAIHA